MTRMTIQAGDADACAQNVYFSATDQGRPGLAMVKHADMRIDKSNLIVAPSGSETAPQILISGSDGDFFNVNLSSFEDDLSVTICKDAAPNKVVFEGVHRASHIRERIFELVFFGAYSDLHMVVLDAGTAEVEFSRFASEPSKG